MAIENLTEDLLMEILGRLPVKSLLQFKSVCKNWYALIQSPNFVYLHHDRAASIAAAGNTDCLLVKRFLNGGEGGVTLSFVPNETPVEDVDISSTGLDIKHLQILGPCNGVVCLIRFGSSSPIVLCNPSIKEFRKASKLIAKRSSPMDGQFFLIKHLLILREQIAPSDIEFSVTHKELDFSHLLDHLRRILRGQVSLFDWSRSTSLARTLSPRVLESQIDAKKFKKISCIFGFIPGSQQ